MTDLKKEIGLRIKEERKINNLTQENLSEQLGISVKHLSEVERGLSGLSIENLIKCSIIFSVSFDYLIKGIKSDNKYQEILNLLQTIPDDKINNIKEIIKNSIQLLN